MIQRPRRNRRTHAIRQLVQENLLRPQQLVQPLFLMDGQGQKQEISSLPGNYRLSLDQAIPLIESCLEVGVQSFVLFPVIPEQYKDKTGSYGQSPGNFYLRLTRQLRERFPDICLISDVALDPYNSDGHDGLVQDGYVQNDATLPLLAQQALLQAEAGFDYIAPSDMMDGRIASIRTTLDQAGYTDTGILAYTAKYASAYYGPFRAALDSAPVEADDIPKDKKTYQMNPVNRRAALREAELDTQEGADMLMVKPALHYLDIISDLKQNSHLPIAAYHVSGECAMLLAACRNGWLDYEQAMPEVLGSIHRAGADVILTYFAKDYGDWYRKMNGW